MIHSIHMATNTTDGILTDDVIVSKTLTYRTRRNIDSDFNLAIA